METSTGHLEQLVTKEDSIAGGKEPKEETTCTGEKSHDEEEKSDEDVVDNLRLLSLFK